MTNRIELHRLAHETKVLIFNTETSNIRIFKLEDIEVQNGACVIRQPDSTREELPIEKTKAYFLSSSSIIPVSEPQ